jgi:hypothetical protein
MDINYCIDYLELNANSYKLDQSNSPHKITYWDDANPDKQPTDAELKTAWAEIEVDRKATQYQRDRQPEYPAIGEQLDLLWHAIDDETLDKTSDFYTSLKATKDKYPKP